MSDVREDPLYQRALERAAKELDVTGESLVPCRLRGRICAGPAGCVRGAGAVRGGLEGGSGALMVTDCACIAVGCASGMRQ